MIALITSTSRRPADTTGPSPFLGFRAFFRKELAEWIRARRALVLAIASSATMTLTTLSARLAVWSAGLSHVKLTAQPPLDPTLNVLAKWDQWVFFFAILSSVSLVIGERDRGTLAWSLSKPMSRSALLLAKWAAGVVMFTASGIVLPMILCVLVAIPAYGMPDIAAVVTGTILLAATPAFFIALALALGVVLPGQAAVGGAGLIVALVPGIIGTLAPDVAAALPPSIGPWAIAVALHAPAPIWTPVGWAVGMIVAAALAIRALDRADL